MRAALFDVGGTLIMSAVRDPWHAIVLERLNTEFDSPPWAEALYAADRRGLPTDPYRQQTNRWLTTWFHEAGVDLADVDVERVRAAFAPPLPADFYLTRGADKALRWCKTRGLKVVLVTNTFNASDQEVRRDWDRLGFAETIDHVVTSYSTGWQKPHPAIFQRALSLIGVGAAEACMTGDELVADIRGAKAVGMRTVWVPSGERGASGSAESDAALQSLAELPETLGAWMP